MSDTPETDAAVIASKGQWSFVLKETCERLERERDELREERAAMQQDAQDYIELADKLDAVKRERDEARDLHAKAIEERRSTECEVDAMLERALTAERERDEARAELKWMTQLALDMAKELKLKCKDVIHEDQVRELTDMINNSNKEAAK